MIAAPLMGRSARVPAKSAFTPARKALLQRKCECGVNAGAEGECEACKKNNQVLQRRASGSQPAHSTAPIVQQVLSTPGRPLNPATRGSMEQDFGHDFRSVRIHDDARAAESARAVNAHAYTVGQDIVFGAGKYAPDSGPGRALLAHELAHTVQQRGLQRSAAEPITTPTSSEDKHLEKEAEQAAASVAGNKPAPPLRSSASRAMISKADATAAAPAQNDAQKEIQWQALNKPTADKLQYINGFQTDSADASHVRFRIDKFLVPKAKGTDALKIFQSRAQAGALEATLDVPKDVAALKQQRDPTPELRNSWLTKLKWDPASAVDNWYKSGGKDLKPSTEFKPVLSDGSVCQMDHIVELQVGGTNVPENVQVLNQSENASSGSQIKNRLAELADLAAPEAPKAQRVILHFEKAEEHPEGTSYNKPDCAASVNGKAKRCLDVESCAQKGGFAAGAASGLEAYAITSGGSPAELQVKPLPEKTTDLAEFKVNSAARQIIPGLLLNKLSRSSDSKPDTITAGVDLASKTKTPLKDETGELTFSVGDKKGESRELKLMKNKNTKVSFLYPYLSEARLNFDHDPQKGLSAKGTLTPSLPLLRQVTFDLALSEGKLTAKISADPKKIQPPFPGVRFTELSVGADLLPEFDPKGTIKFEVGPEKKPFASGSFEAKPDADGLLLAGDLSAQIPGTDSATGHVEYRNQEWHGFVELDASKIHLPGFQSGALRIDFNPDGTINPTCTIQLLIANNPVSLKASFSKGKLDLSADATVALPGLKETKLTLHHDGDKLTGQGSAHVEIKGLSGTITVTYTDGKVSGEGDVSLGTERAKGSVHLRISPEGKISGKGSATVKLTDKLTGTVDIVKPEEGDLRVKGKLAFPPVKLFDGIEKQFTLFDYTQDFGIPGLSIPVINVGVVVRITGNVSAAFGFGPGMLKNISVEAGFNPLADDKDFEADANAQLDIPAHADLSVSIRAAAGLSIKAASVTAGITATGAAGLHGGFSGDVHLGFHKSVFTVDAEAKILMRPMFRFGLDADVTAEASALGVQLAHWQKVWKLYGVQWSPEAEAGLIAKLHYSSQEGFTFPSGENIQWIKPQIDPGDVLRRMFSSQN